RIQATRCRLVEALQRSGFHTVASQTNFVWATHPDGQHKQVFEQLKTRKILVRYMAFGHTSQSRVRDGLRITVGTDEQVDRFIDALQSIIVV
ncbi:MAG: aminotransferase class I/II-fold pyridoxal phosphate-dependent enzyme, partial [Planctomycetaceae bacterium]